MFLPLIIATKRAYTFFHWENHQTLTKQTKRFFWYVLDPNCWGSQDLRPQTEQYVALAIHRPVRLTHLIETQILMENLA